MTANDSLNRPAACPAPETLAALASGTVAPADLEGLTAHLAVCAECVSAYEACAQEDPLTAALRHVAEEPGSASEPECQALQARARALRPGRTSKVPRSAPPPPAQVGVYRVQEPLGHGGMGRVYKAWHTRLKRAVALKMLPTDRMNDPAAVARFHREMEAVGRLDHANLIRATDAGEADGVHFLVMEVVEGLDLGRLVRRLGPLPVADACELIRQAAVGLQYVHENGLVHRDIKPSNLMLTPPGRVKVLDLGLARLYGHGTGDELTGTGQWMGTADYMAPEQGDDARRVDIRADVYSLGCSLYKLLAGRAPFSGSEYDSTFKKMRAHAETPVPPLASLRPGLPGGLLALLARLLAKNPADRPADPGQVAVMLEPFTRGCDLAALLVQSREATEADADHEPGAGPAPLAASVPRASGKPRRVVRPLLLATAGLLAVGLIGGLVLYGLPAGTPTATEPKPPADLPRGVWIDLLKRPPMEIVRPGDEPVPVWDEKRQQLFVSSSGPVLIGLGTTPEAGYKFQVGLTQPRWVGGVGVFWGLREEVHDGQKRWHYQWIEIAPPVRGQEDFRRLARGKGRMDEVGGGFRSAPMSMYSHRVRRPANVEQLLEIEVGRRTGLTRVRFAGEDLSTLFGGEANAPFTPKDYEGAFGITTNLSTVVVSNARLMLAERENP